jgi:hypothetical protein
MADTAKAAVTTDDGETRELDIIEFNGQHWIVADWISLTRSGPKQPRRLLRLSTLSYQPADPGAKQAQIKVTTPLSDALLREGPAPAGSGIEILDAQYKLQKDGSLQHVGFAPPMQKETAH